MGYETPNIDRIGKEGVRFLQYYGEQSCTAGRAAFLTGQHGIRTGLTKVGYPGAPMGLSQLDPTANVMEDTLREIKAGRKLKEAFPQLQKAEPAKK